MPKLFTIVKDVFLEKDDAEEGEAGGTTDTQNEAENAISLLEVFIDKIAEGYSSYVEETIKVFIFSNFFLDYNSTL